MSCIRRVSLLSAILVCVALSAAAQEQRTADKAAQPLRDETFNLNIIERRIVETDFLASTAVGFESAEVKNLEMSIGVALRATKIDVLLRNVTGTVRFRGSVQRILDLVNSRSVRSPR